VEVQSAAVKPETPLGRELDAALDEVLALSNLEALFGTDATRNPCEPFSRHFARQVRLALAALPACTNPYLWQMLAGTYPPNYPAPWFTLPRRSALPEIRYIQSFMLDALTDSEGSYDFIHLSNILDWLSPDAAQSTLRKAWSALNTGGWIFIRQLNSTLDVAALGPEFQWKQGEASRAHAMDRSFFYRALHLGQKQ